MENGEQPIAPIVPKPWYAKPLARIAIVAFTANVASFTANALIDHDTNLTAPHIEAPAPVQESEITLDVEPLTTERAIKYKASTVIVSKDIKKGYNAYGGDCTGSYLGNGLVITAAHCGQKVSDGVSLLNPRDEDGNDVRARLFIDWQGEEFDVDNEFYFPKFTKGNYNYDVELLEVSDLKDLEENADWRLTSLDLAEGESPGLGQSIYFYGKYGSPNSKIYGGKVVELPSKHDASFSILINYDEDAVSKSGYDICVPGTSGTGVVNDKAELMGVMVSTTEPFYITKEDIDRYHLAPSELGKPVAICNIMPLYFVLKLVEQATANSK